MPVTFGRLENAQGGTAQATSSVSRNKRRLSFTLPFPAAPRSRTAPLLLPFQFQPPSDQEKNADLGPVIGNQPEKQHMKEQRHACSPPF